MSEISASSLGVDRFCLDSMTQFDKFLLFTDHNTLFITNLEDYFVNPQWFTPRQVRKIDLKPFMMEYSAGKYKGTDNIASLHVQSTCLEHLSVYILTELNGILMLEVNKESFYSQNWQTENLTMTDINSDINPYRSIDPKNLLKYSLGDSYSTEVTARKAIIADGRLLDNYYNFPLDGTLYAVNNRMMGMLIRINFGEGFHVYLFRCFNLLSHAKSIVYFDKPLSNYDECKSIIIEDEGEDDGIVSFILLCDTYIVKLDVSEKSQMVINTRHEFWKDPNNKLVVNITQSTVFVSNPDYALINIKVKNGDSLIQSNNYLAGGLTLLGVAVISILMVKTLLKE